MTTTTAPYSKRQIVRFAGDSGDGIQLQGQQFTLAQALSGHDVSTLPDFPAEIRAPAGSRFGVSAFQIQFGTEQILTPGESPDALIVFNPAALMVNLPTLRPGALIILDEDSFTARNLRRAGLENNPLTDGSLQAFTVHAIPVSQLTTAAVQALGLTTREALRCRNFWVLGLVLWLFDQPRDSIVAWIRARFVAAPLLCAANLAALNAGHSYAETIESAHVLEQRHITPATPPLDGEYRALTGAEAVALGLAAVSELAGLNLLFCSYPITPASSLLHHLASMPGRGIATFQAEDEIAAICAAIGASYGGNLGVTSSSGPGIALKTEAMGLAVATELPLLIIDSQRAGPSTGMPTKTEQSDLLQAIHGRHADTPVPVLAARSPADCFATVIEAARIAIRHMSPVILLTDGYIANASELFAIPDFDAIEPISSNRPDAASAAEIFLRDPETLGRTWVRPGDPRHVHRIGGLEKDIVTGDISYDGANHQKMTDMRLAKVRSVANFIPPQKLEQGTCSGLAVVAWGSTYGAVWEAVHECLCRGLEIGQVHVRHLHPLATNLGDLLGCFARILVAELNTGQLAAILREQLLLPVEQYNQVTGQPLHVAQLIDSICRYAPVRDQQKRHA